MLGRKRERERELMSQNRCNGQPLFHPLTFFVRSVGIEARGREKSKVPTRHLTTQTIQSSCSGSSRRDEDQRSDSIPAIHAVRRTSSPRQAYQMKPIQLDSSPGKAIHTVLRGLNIRASQPASQPAIKRREISPIPRGKREEASNGQTKHT
ncbi:hypothetical protein PV04_08859 [Phialophora macrospora]|uniref:Uncharacterized protein n=1 Tax=Phialophora macrospora TaxID=1851006 RepID=A0A0D2CFI6_9EURO|nr:hypothetical protein PV04_08859 [Phialophora macrospora]